MSVGLVHAAGSSGYAELATTKTTICAELAIGRAVIHAESATHSYKSLILSTYRGRMWPILRNHAVSGLIGAGSPSYPVTVTMPQSRLLRLRRSIMPGAVRGSVPPG
jgi:hypothetical protein